MAELFIEREDATRPPFIRCFKKEEINIDAVRSQCAGWGYGVFEIDVFGLSSVSMLMSRFAEAMQFPHYSGKNWDALIDMATDLSWSKHPGYVAFIKNAECLSKIGDEVVRKTLVVCKAVTRQWQSGENEEGKQVPVVAFYWIFLSTPSACADIRTALES